MRRRTHLKPLQKAFVSWAVFALALSPASPALAAGTDATPSGSIVINQPTSHSAHAYQVFSGAVDGDGSLTDIEWGSGVNGAALLADLKTLSAFASCSSARDVAECLKVATPGTETELAQSFAEAVSRNLRTDKGVAFVGTETPTASGLAEGWYVVASDYDTDLAAGASLLFPGLITVGTGASSVTPKESAPTLVKEVCEDSTGKWQSHADFEIGQSFQQHLIATIGDADLNYYTSYYLGFSDTLSEGLDLDLSSVSVTIDGTPMTSRFTIGYENRKLSVVAQDIKDAIHAGSVIIVTYTTRLNEHAEIGAPGNDNSATLTYSADPRSAQEGKPGLRNTTLNEDTVSYTYELKLTKTDEADSSKTLAGATFSLHRTSDNHYAVLSVAGGDPSRVYVTGWAETAEAGGTVTTGADGCAYIVGLDSEDEYVLNELVAPDGYDLDTSDIPFAIAADAAAGTALSSLSVSVSGSQTTEGSVSEGRVSAVVTDVKAPILPVTGLGGIVASVVLGSGLVAAAATVIVRQTSDRNRE